MIILFYALHNFSMSDIIDTREFPLENRVIPSTTGRMWRRMMPLVI